MKPRSATESFSASLIWLIALALAALGGCSTMQRSDSSGYRHREMEPNQSRARKAASREVAMEELGYRRDRDLSDRDMELLDLRAQLSKAEKSLEGRREREQYFRNKPYLRGDADRLELLSLPSYDDRQQWLNAKGIQASTVAHPPMVQSLVDVNDIAVGMTKQAVKDSWGEPELVEVSGNPMYGNERWHYSEQTQSAEGYRSQHRMLYFESGRVVGWESH